MTAIRRATADDGPFLAEMLACAADWRTEVPRSVDAVLADPALAHYVAGWPRSGDGGVVADVDGQPIGAAWWRFFTDDDRGYGFVDASVPEMSIAVRAGWRGGGVGRALVAALIDAARTEGLERLSLSVEQDNPARRLYERAGFRTVASAAGSDTMVVEL